MKYILIQLLLVLSACDSDKKDFGQVSDVKDGVPAAEKATVLESPFLETPEVPNQQASISYIDEEISNQDSYIPENKVTNNLKEDLTFIDSKNRCRPEDEQKEKEEVLKFTQENPGFVPVQFSIAFGTADDNISENAHMHAMLNTEDKGTHIQMIDSKYYIVDHEQAKKDFLTGKRCFYAAVEIKNCVNYKPNYEEGFYFQANNITYLGNNRYEKKPLGYSNKSSVQEDSKSFAYLLVADLREFRGGGYNFIRDNYQSPTQRNTVVESGLKKIFDFKKIFIYREAIAYYLARPFERVVDKKKKVSPGIVGAERLLDNLLETWTYGVGLPKMYTPIVFDLGKEKIRTSSLDFGTYFDLANIGLSHKTAWLGSEILSDKKFSDDDYDYFVNRSDDGFLVIPDSKGKVKSGAQLFGDQMMDESSDKFTNGYEALQALAKKYDHKDCSILDKEGKFILNEEMKKRLQEEGDAYRKELLSSIYLLSTDRLFQKLKIWVDRNRDGVSDKEELLSLNDAHVKAINVCYINKAGEKDVFGNLTQFKSTFLMDDQDENGFLKIDENKIFEHLLGKSKGNFRMSVDIEFQVNEEKYLELPEEQKEALKISAVDFIN